jgi:hypothetical protein
MKQNDEKQQVLNESTSQQESDERNDKNGIKN